MPDTKLLHYEIVNDLLLLKWDNKKEDFLSLRSMRDNCPCANCSGETDDFGNVYKGPTQTMKEESYQITGIRPIGYYAIQPFWKDGHHDGIFSFDFLKKFYNCL